MNFIKLVHTSIANFDILKVFSLNAVSTMVRMFTGFISVKVVALIIGPSGIALLGQLNNIISILLGLASGGINSGITKYISEYKDNAKKVRIIISNAFKIILFFTCIVAVNLIVFNKYLSKTILLSEDYGYVFIVFGLTIILYSLNGLILSILNGYKQFGLYVKVSIFGTIFGCIFSLALVIPFGLKGALLNAVTFQSVMFFVTFYMCRKCIWLRLDNFMGHFDKQQVRDFLHYSLMTMVALSCAPVSQMLLRGFVISEISIDEAGWWEGVNRISNMYLGIVTTSFSVYYLPRLSEIKDNNNLRTEIFRCYKVIIPILLVLTISIYLLRNFIIWLLFTPDFEPMSNFFIWQLLGDFFKIASWLLSYLMVAKAKTVAFISSEIIFTLLFVGLSFLLMRINGTIGITQAYMINYIVYLIAMIVLFRKILFTRRYSHERSC